MSALFGFLASLLARYFSGLAVQIGLQKALHVALFAAWLGFTVAFTAVANSCVSPSGYCGGIASNWSNLSQWVKFGFSLVPFEIVQIIGCLISLHVAGYCYLVMFRVIGHMSLGNGKGLAKL
jgi:hypothetical protein